MSKIIIDVGAYNGSPFLERAEKEPDLLVYAFEPDPRTYTVLKEASACVKNYHLLQKAVCEKSGIAQFILTNYDAASSLLEHSDTVESDWPLHFHCFDVLSIIDVETVRLDEFVAEHGIDHIDYLSVDAQGMDLSVLKSLGNQISIVTSGCVETTNKGKNTLYKNSFDYDNLVEFLVSNNFTITSISPNDQYGNELNVCFEKTGV